MHISDSRAVPGFPEPAPLSSHSLLLPFPRDRVCSRKERLWSQEHGDQSGWPAIWGCLCERRPARSWGQRDFKAFDCAFMMEVPVTPSMYFWKKNELS